VNLTLIKLLTAKLKTKTARVQNANNFKHVQVVFKSLVILMAI